MNASMAKLMLTGDVDICEGLLTAHLCMVQRFKIKRSKLKDDYYLSYKDKECIKSILERINFIADTLNSTNEWNEAQIPNVAINLCFGRIAHAYGLNGFYYAYNVLLTPGADGMHCGQNYFQKLQETYVEFNDFSKAFFIKAAHDNKVSFFTEFYQKYLQFDLRPFNGNSCLVRVKSLKNQKCSDLQTRAQHLSNSFAHIMANVSIRANSRNQTEYPIASIVCPWIQLRVRPKYLSSVSNIYMYESCFYSWPEYRNLINGLLKDPKNDVLFLPHVVKDNGDNKCIGAPINIYSLPIFQLRNKEKYNNLILDVGISSFLIFETRNNLEHWQNAVTSLPFEIQKKIWEKAMVQMKKNMHPDDRKIEKALIKANMELFDRHYNELMKVKMDKIKDFMAFGIKMAKECKDRVEKSIGKSIRQNAIFYTKLFTEIGRQMLEFIGEQHPQYLGLYESKSLNVLEKLKGIYQTSVLLNYLRSNARGHHLHVICSGSNQFELLWNIKNYMAAELQKEWNIQSFNESRNLIDEIIKYPQDNRTTNDNLSSTHF